MKNTLFASIFIFVFGCLGFIGLPWWALAPLAAIAFFLFPTSGGKAFAGGLAAGTLLWTLAAFLLNSGNGGMLSAKVGQLFMGLTGAQLLWITGLLGGLLAAFGGLTGAYARLMLFPVKHRPKYNKYR